MNAVVFGALKHSSAGDATASGLIEMLKVDVVRILLLLALVPAAYAQLPQGRLFSANADALLLDLPFPIRLELGLAPATGSSVGAPSSVFTDDYWSRAYAQRAQLEDRFGIHLADRTGWQPYLVQRMPFPGHPHFNFVQELRWPGGHPLTGLQFERKDLLLRGDRLTIRATSDIQTLVRGVGLSGSETENDVLSLLGWRSHSRMVWQLGEPTREFQWQFSAGFDRRASTQRSSVELQMLRRF